MINKLPFHFYKKSVIDKLKTDFKNQGFQVSYRNREGKQYIYVESDDLRLGDYEKLDKKCTVIFKANNIEHWHSTSGSYRSRVYRINPDEFWDWRK